MSRIFYCRFYEPEVVCELVHMSLAFFVYRFWQAFYDDGFCCRFLKHCVYKRNLMFEGFISEHVILCETNGYFPWIWMTALHLTFVCFCVCAGWPFRSISLILTALPVTDHDALRLATVRQQEETRQTGPGRTHQQHAGHPLDHHILY